LPASPYASHAAIAFEPFPFGSHCTCPSSQISGFTVVGSDSSLARCRGCATFLGMLATFGVVCHAQLTPQDASGVPSCETELASCQAVLGAVGTKKAEHAVPLAAVTAETGTPSSASKGARLRCSPPPIRLACTDCVRIDARALRVCMRTARAVQSHVRSSARTRVARCSRPTARTTPSRTQPAAQPCCGTVKLTAVRAWVRPARVSPGRSHLYPYVFIIYRERLRPAYLYVRMCPSANVDRCINATYTHIYMRTRVHIHVASIYVYVSTSIYPTTNLHAANLYRSIYLYLSICIDISLHSSINI
jgi:hypothetical protein